MHHRIGVLGGTFDPIHSAHIAAADTAVQLFNLDQVYFVPAGIAYHRDSSIASPQQRLDMTRLALDGDSRFEVSSVDVERPGNTYTLETLHDLKRRFVENFPHDTAEWFLILGADAFEAFGSWRDPLGILSECQLVVISRPGGTTANYPDFPAHRVDIPGWEISSTEIRSRIARGESVQGLLPQAVMDYIRENDLYTSNKRN